MRKRSLLILGIVICMVSALLSGCVKDGSQSGSKNNEAGKQVIGKFTAEDLDGNAVDESILSGKKVTMINLWAPWCGPCVEEMPDLQEMHEKFADKGFQVIGVISNDDLKDADKTLEKTGVKYTVLKLGDSSSELYKAVYNHAEFSNAIPFSFFVDENGKQLGPAYLGARNWEPIISELLGE